MVPLVGGGGAIGGEGGKTYYFEHLPVLSTFNGIAFSVRNKPTREVF